MGHWSIKYFDRDILPENCILFAGTTKDALKANILSNYQTVTELQHCLFEAYEASQGNSKTLLVFQLFSAVMIADLLHYLNDGKVKNVIFIGAAFSFVNTLQIGSVVIPTSVKPMDGLVDYIENVHETAPSKSSYSFLSDLFERNKIEFIHGLTVSIPSVFVKPHNMSIDSNWISMEMECASLYFYSRKLGLSSIAIQVISDKMNHQLYENQNARYITIKKIANILSKQETLG